MAWFCSRVRAPVGSQAVAPPFLRELGELRDGNRPARRATGEPALDVILRPEEVHRASGEDDVVPPARGGDEAVEDEALVVGPHVANLELIASPQSGHEVSIRPSAPRDDADPERIPGAVRKPIAIRGVHAKRSRDGRERVRHADRRVRKVEDERVRLVEAPPTLLHLGCRRAHGGPAVSSSVGARPSSDKEPICRVSEVDVRLVHG